MVLANGLQHRFGAVQALAGLDFQVGAGELYGLVGPDGAGKTTAMRALAGLIRPGAGSIRVAGRDPVRERGQVRELLGYMPQRYSLYGDLSVGENLRFFGRLFCLDRVAWRERSQRLLAITRLAPFVDRRADALSGGMYKKLALSCALLHEPRVLLLDEPTNGVDPISRLELWDLLYEFVHGGMTVLVTTSYMDEAARCARVGLVHQGRLLVEGRPGDLVGGFEGVVLRATGGGEALEARLEGLGPAVLAVTPLGAGVRLVVRGEAASQVERALGAAGASVERVAPTFEDLFLEKVG
jgi:ABC-2 type transport system ATP-binding protein